MMDDRIDDSDTAPACACGAELLHRTGNLLALVQALAAMTSAASTSLADFQPRFMARLAALGRAQRLIARRHSAGVGLRELLTGEIGACALAAPDRLQLAGPEVRLTEPSVALLALAVHELLANACRHGALSSGGQIRVTWQAQPSEIALLWIEEHVGVDLSAPLRRGFGRQLVEGALPYQLGARTTWAISGHGLRCELLLPLTRTAAADAVA